MPESDDDLPVPARSDREVVGRLADAARSLKPPARPGESDVPALDAGQQSETRVSPPTPTSAAVPPRAALSPVDLIRARAYRHDRAAWSIGRADSWSAVEWPEWLPPLLRAQIRNAANSPLDWTAHALGTVMHQEAGGLEPRWEREVLRLGAGVAVRTSSREGPVRVVAAGRFVPIARRAAAVVLLWPDARRGEVLHVFPPEPGSDEVRARFVTSAAEPQADDLRLRDRRLAVAGPSALYRPGDRVIFAGRLGGPTKGLVVEMLLRVAERSEWRVVVQAGRRRYVRSPEAVRHDLSLPPGADAALSEVSGV